MRKLRSRSYYSKAAIIKVFAYCLNGMRRHGAKCIKRLAKCRIIGRKKATLEEIKRAGSLDGGSETQRDGIQDVIEKRRVSIWPNVFARRRKIWKPEASQRAPESLSLKVQSRAGPLIKIFRRVIRSLHCPSPLQGVRLPLDCGRGPRGLNHPLRRSSPSHSLPLTLSLAPRHCRPT
jgi:hypothetical protein